MDKAKELLEEAANLGNADAQYNLGLLYKEGDTPLDLARYEFWLNQAAEQGHDEAKSLLESGSCS